MSTVPSARTAPVPSVAPGVLRSLVATGICGASTALLAGIGASTARATHIRLDEVVSGAVLAVGAVAAALLTVGCVLLTLTAVARAAGRTLDRVERVTARLTPALLRRAVAVTITTGIGLGAVSGVATASEIDLGWDVTQSTSTPQEPARVAPPTDDPGLGEGDAAAAAAEQGAARDSAALSPSAPAPDAAPEAARQTAVVPGSDMEPTLAEALEPARAPAVSAPSSSTAPTSDTTTDGTTNGTTVGTTDGTTVSTATTTTTAATHPAVPVGPAAPATVTVRAGDTLWGIAASHLPPGSDDAAVAAAWPRWYEANRDVVGPEPGLIHPGQVLAAPGAP